MLAEAPSAFEGCVSGDLYCALGKYVSESSNQLNVLCSTTLLHILYVFLTFATLHHLHALFSRRSCIIVFAQRPPCFRHLLTSKPIKLHSDHFAMFLELDQLDRFMRPKASVNLVCETVRQICSVILNSSLMHGSASLGGTSG